MTCIYSNCRHRHGARRLLFRNLKLSEEKISRLNEELGESVVKLEAATGSLRPSVILCRTTSGRRSGISLVRRKPRGGLCGMPRRAGYRLLSRIQRGAGKMNQLIDDLLRSHGYRGRR